MDFLVCLKLLGRQLILNLGSLSAHHMKSRGGGQNASRPCKPHADVGVCYDLRAVYRPVHLGYFQRSSVIQKVISLKEIVLWGTAYERASYVPPEILCTTLLKPVRVHLVGKILRARPEIRLVATQRSAVLS